MKRFYTFFLILLLSFTGWIPHTALAQNENEADWMPDANLRTAVRNELGLADNEALTQAKMLDVGILEAPNSQIANLTGLEYATKLKYLILDRNNISNLTPLQNLTELQELKLGRNKVSDVTPLGGLTALRILRLTSNSVTDATPLGNLVNLEWLRIKGNKNITNLHVLAGLPKLNNYDITIPDPPADPTPDPQPPADTDPPEVSISGFPSGVQNGVFDVTITFTEAVSDFVQSDLSLSGTATASITEWNTNDNTTYTATITPTSSGTVTMSVAANVATDAANNPNTAATAQTVTVDVDRPKVTIGVPSGTQTGAFNATITFSETVSGFAQSDVSLSGSAASITDWRANSDNTLYTATITPTASGTVTISVAANVATDAANNPNTAAAPQTVTVDVDRPAVTIGVPSGTQTGAFNATITFSETVSGFAQSDVSLTGAATSITGWNTNTDNTVYTATITPTASGTVTISVPANVATDAANNPNTAATSQTVSVSVDTDPPSVSLSVPSGVQNGAFDATMTFSESVSDFVQADLGLSGAASITDWNANNDNTVYTATITPTASGTVTVSVAANVATDAAGNPNTAAAPQTVTVDVDRPTVTIGVPSGTQTGVFDATITFSETVSGFTQSEVSLTGSAASITDWNANSDNTVYTATITPTASGTVTVSVAADVATDAAGNKNTAATSQTVSVSVDTDPPSVSLSVPSGVQNGAFDATMTFSESVSDFVQADLGLSGAASITDWNANNDNTVYTATITPTASGTVTVSVAANVATDAAGNPNTAAAPQTVTVDVDRPAVTIGVPSGTQTGAYDATITFSETVSGFTQSDVSLTGSAASITDWRANSDNTVYTATITPTASGTVTISVPANVATDAANNPNTAATSQTITIEIPPAIPDPVTWMPNANLRSAVRSALGLATDATFTQAQLGQLTELWASQSGISNITGLEHATELTKLSLWGNDISNLAPIKDLTKLTYLRLARNGISDVSLLSGLTALTSLGLQHNNIVDVAPLATLVNLTWLRLAGNSITDLSPLVTLVNVTDSDVDLPDPDTTAPGVSISVPSGVQNGAFSVSITFTETVSGFTQSDVSLSGSAASITDWRANSDNTLYTATITPTTSGTLTLNVAANVATDAANNPNTAATAKNVTVDIDRPTATISVPSGTLTGVFDATITFSETVSGFAQSDVSLSGSAASITDWRTNSDNTLYTATITPTASGTVTISVAANVATDAANNPNTAATSQTVTVSVDTNPPSVSLSVPSGVQNSAFSVSVTFTEVVSGFTQSDLSVSGTATASITEWNTNDNTTYTTTITPTTSGTVTMSVAANVATDAANNPNTAATSQTVTVDVDRPTVTIGVPSGIQIGTFNATITFSETVSGFTQSDVSLSGSAASITDWRANSDNTVYTATITPTASGTVTMSVPANVATDAANNPNTAATSQTITIEIPPAIPDPVTWMPDANLRSAIRSALGLATDATFTQTQLQQLTKLFASQSGISDITGLKHATELTKLSLWRNDISNLAPLKGLTQLTYLRLGRNNISDVSLLSGLTALTSLGLQHNNIVDVAPLASLVNLTWLRLAGNSITDLSALVTLVKVTDSDVDLPDPDTTAPGVTVSVPSGVQNGAFSVSITFTETVSGFTQSDVSLSGSAASITDWRANNDNTVYTATITPSSSGIITFNINAGVATDVANNPNTAATLQTVTVDVDSPSVSITVPKEVQSDTFNVTILFNESVSGFQPPDISLTGSTATATIVFTGVSTTPVWFSNPLNDAEYTVSITPTTSGQLTISVPAGVATDTASNPNLAAQSQTVNVDVDPPTVNLSVPSGEQTGAFDVTITFTEAVSDFVQSDLSVTGTATATITLWETTDNITYTAKITPTISGDAVLSIAAGVATDAAGNPNLAATPQTVPVLIAQDSPGVSITVPSSVQTGAFDVTITFTEAVSDFVQSDLSLSGSATASITEWETTDNTVYTAEITPTTSGEVTISVSANVATDAASNPNTAATPQFVTVLVAQQQINIESLTWMPDVNLIRQVLSALGLTDSNDLTQAGMATLTQLTATNADISDLTGLEHAINLTHLNLEGNSITNIVPIKGLDNLIYLNLSHNQLGQVSSSNGLWIHHHHWPNLQELDLSHNRIYCSGYSIFSDHDGGSPRIYADPLPSLTHLDVSHNRQLGDSIIAFGIPIQTSPGISRLNLTHLDMCYTDIQSLRTILYDYPHSSLDPHSGSRLEWLRVEGTTFAHLYELREIAKRGITPKQYLIDAIDIDVEVPEGHYWSNVPLYPPAPEQEKWMPDFPLRTAIREKLGLSDGEFLTQTKILELTELEVSDQDIYTTEGDIYTTEGLEHATNLTSLDLSGTPNFGWDILRGIYRLPNLETLKLSDPQSRSATTRIWHTTPSRISLVPL